MTKYYNRILVIPNDNREIRINFENASNEGIYYSIIWQLCSKETDILIGITPSILFSRKEIKKVDGIYLPDRSVVYKINTFDSFVSFKWGYHIFYILGKEERNPIDKIIQNYSYLKSKDMDNIATGVINNISTKKYFSGFEHFKLMAITAYDMEAIKIIPLIKSSDELRDRILSILNAMRSARNITCEEYTPNTSVPATHI